MDEQPAIHNTFVLERSYPAAPERVFAALSDPSQKRRWFAEADHHDTEHFASDFQVGGREQARYRLREGTPLPGAVFTHDAVYLDIVKGRRVVSAATMAREDRRISAALMTFEIVAAEGGGTQLIFTHQAAFFAGSDGPEMRQAGWQALLDKLGRELAG